MNTAKALLAEEARTPAIDVTYWMRYRRAPLPRRLLSFFIDASIVSVLQLIPATLFYLLGLFVETQGIGLSLLYRILYFSINVSLWALYVCYFYQYYGGTPGKLLLRLRIIDKRWGTNPTIGQTVTREVFGKLLSLLVLGAGFIIALFDRRFGLTLHDRICHTQVLYCTEGKNL